MFKFRKAPRDALNDLEAFLNGVGTEPVEWLVGHVHAFNEFNYADIEDAILSGRLDELIGWQNRYASFVNEKLTPLWLAAIARASHVATRGRITIDDSDIRVKEFLQSRGGELISQLTDESRRAVASVILHGQHEHLAPRDIARQIRPLIGLNRSQAQANAAYRQRIYNKLVESGLSPAQAALRADSASTRYASKQHRRRAETIVHTELARAYNQGAFDGVQAAQRAGLMGRCEMIWSTAGTNRVCGRCLSLKDSVVGHTDEVGVQLPPLHPRCRCVIVYRESSKSPRGNVRPTTDALAAPYPAGRGYRSPTHFPQAVNNIKSFEDLKLYWAENYNVKVSEGIGKLHFESVKTVLVGVETVLKEFPPAMRHLREFGLLDTSLMTTERGNGKINFNPEYFNDAAKLAATLAAGVHSGFYHRNMSPFSVGAHEAGHIAEDWLLDKYGGDVSSRIVPRQIVRKAYTRAIQTVQGTGKTVFRLTGEISEYATKNLSECLALAVSDYLTNGERAALLSREIWRALKEELD